MNFYFGNDHYMNLIRKLYFESMSYYVKVIIVHVEICKILNH